LTTPTPLCGPKGGRRTGFGPDPYGGVRSGFSATSEINRRDFASIGTRAIEGGGVVVSDKVTITIEAEAVLDR